MVQEVSTVGGVIGSGLAMEALVGHVKEMNSILETVGSCYRALIGVDLNLENVHLDLHFGKISLATVLVWTRRGRLNLEL